MRRGKKTDTNSNNVSNKEKQQTATNLCSEVNAEIVSEHEQGELGATEGLLVFEEMHENKTQPVHTTESNPQQPHEMEESGLEILSSENDEFKHNIPMDQCWSERTMIR
ncbi:hypothetical protein EGW08_011285 [Elysia chlorotica]|uniref:Uncharacterized protein n=1 Tax=Elysia chlorotica TaxID=188477 RepID=A0A433THA5_ELYCH|nr:hypothetical protein EGW08_011285 [Elysia chlorotica]